MGRWRRAGQSASLHRSVVSLHGRPLLESRTAPCRSRDGKIRNDKCAAHARRAESGEGRVPHPGGARIRAEQDLARLGSVGANGPARCCGGETAPRLHPQVQATARICPQHLKLRPHGHFRAACAPPSGALSSGSTWPGRIHDYRLSSRSSGPRSPRGQHGSSTRSGNDGNQPGTTGITLGHPAHPRRPADRSTRGRPATKDTR